MEILKATDVRALINNYILVRVLEFCIYDGVLGHTVVTSAQFCLQYKKFQLY